MIEKNFLINFSKKLYESSLKIILLTHKNPDGDAIGSCLALFIYLLKFGHKVDIITPTDFPNFFKWLPNSEKIIVFSKKENNKIKKKIYEADIIFFIDFNNISRIKPLDIFLKFSNSFKILIDHHSNPENFNLMLSDSSAPATAILIFRLIKEMKHLNYIDSNLAVCLYTALVSDVGFFRFSTVTSECHIMAAFLIEKNINIQELQDRLCSVYTKDRIKLLVKSLKRIKILNEYNTVYTYLTSNDIKKYNYQKGDTEGFVNYGLNLKNIFLSVFFIEDSIEKIIKISFRSKNNFDVNIFARKYFQGGGHKNAAGGISKENLKTTLNNFLKFLSLYKN